MQRNEDSRARRPTHLFRLSCLRIIALTSSLPISIRTLITTTSSTFQRSRQVSPAYAQVIDLIEGVSVHRSCQPVVSKCSSSYGTQDMVLFGRQFVTSRVLLSESDEDCFNAICTQVTCPAKNARRRPQTLPSS
jgi:hypothetical protein